MFRWIILASGVAVVVFAYAHAGDEGRQIDKQIGDFRCSAHRDHAERGAFQWAYIRFKVEDGQMTGSRDWVNWKGKPGKIEFTGTLGHDGTASVDGKGTVQGRDEFTVTLTGRTSETLAGPMLNDKEEAFRDCTLQLRSIAALLH